MLPTVFPVLLVRSVVLMRFFMLLGLVVLRLLLFVPWFQFVQPLRM